MTIESLQHLTPHQRAELAQLLEARQQIAARESSKRSFLSFVKAVMPADMQPAAHHRLMIEKLQALADGTLISSKHGRKVNGLMLAFPPGAAKALTLDTPIPTPSGWRMMGDLRVGDQVFDERGKPCNVTWKSEIFKDRPIYRVSTDSGTEVFADRDHEWLVRLCGKPRNIIRDRDLGPYGDPRFKIKETWELARHRSKRPMLMCNGPLDLPDADLPIDPYVLGVWLGDGNSQNMGFTSSVDDQPFIRAEIEKAGYKTSSRTNANSFGVLGVTYKFSAFELLQGKAGGNTCRYGYKHIPAIYMRGSIKQRMALLQGLIDTDGTVCRRSGCTTFSNTNETLAEQVAELVRSLGVKACLSSGRATLNGVDCGAAYRVSFYLKDSARLPRKRELTRGQHRTPNTYIDVVECDFRADTVCIEVDSPSHLFLCGHGMLPTHNSTYASVLFPCWLMGRDPRTDMVACSHTAELADRFGRKCRNMIQSPEFKAVFPESPLSSDSKGAGNWAMAGGGEYFATGVGGSPTGRRAIALVMDDLVKSREVADSETEREKAWEWYINDALTRLKPGAIQVVIGTRWHHADIMGRISDVYGDDFEEISIPMLAGENDPLGRQPGERLWPEWFTDQMVQRAQADPRSWAALYQQTPMIDGGGEFKPDWIEYYTGTVDHSRMGKVILVDPAGSKEKRSDFTAMWVVGLGEDENYYVLDIVRDRLNLTERADMIFKLHRKWRPSQVRVERYGLMGDVEYLRQEMKRRVYRFNLYEVAGKLKKEERIKRLIPLFERGRMIFPESFHSAVCGEQRDLVEDFINEEYKTFPMGKHDDMMDALARLCEPDLPLPWPMPQEHSVASNIIPFVPLSKSMGY